jgi:hypothetical protein
MSAVFAYARHILAAAIVASYVGTTASGVYHRMLERVIRIIRTKITTAVDASPRCRCPSG